MLAWLVSTQLVLSTVMRFTTTQDSPDYQTWLREEERTSGRHQPARQHQGELALSGNARQGFISGRRELDIQILTVWKR